MSETPSFPETWEQWEEVRDQAGSTEQAELPVDAEASLDLQTLPPVEDFEGYGDL